MRSKRSNDCMEGNDCMIKPKNGMIVSFRLNFDDPIDYRIYVELMKLSKGDRTKFIKDALFFHIQRKRG